MTSYHSIGDDIMSILVNSTTTTTTTTTTYYYYYYYYYYHHHHHYYYYYYNYNYCCCCLPCHPDEDGIRVRFGRHPPGPYRQHKGGNCSSSSSSRRGVLL